MAVFSCFHFIFPLKMFVKSRYLTKFESGGKDWRVVWFLVGYFSVWWWWCVLFNKLFGYLRLEVSQPIFDKSSMKFLYSCNFWYKLGQLRNCRWQNRSGGLTTQPLTLRNRVCDYRITEIPSDLETRMDKPVIMYYPVPDKFDRDISKQLNDITE